MKLTFKVLTNSEFEEQHLTSALAANYDVATREDLDILVAYWGNRPMGYLAWRTGSDGWMEIHYLEVRPDYARRGVGRQLVAKATDDGNWAARAVAVSEQGLEFFGHLGFTVDPEAFWDMIKEKS